VLECVVNLSEGRDVALLRSISEVAGDQLLDVHMDAHHNRSVLTVAGSRTEDVALRIARRTVELIDVRDHTGVHPRMGALDVVPFVPLTAGGSASASDPDLDVAISARNRFAQRVGEELAVPCFCYGPGRSLPEVRKRAFVDLFPDFGPPEPHPTAGSCAVGARRVLIAYNLWLSTSEVRIARVIAAKLRSPYLRALGFPVGDATQVSLNLVEPFSFGPEAAYDAVAQLAGRAGTGIARAELVGLAPREVVEAVTPARRDELGLSIEQTIESRLESAVDP
jgi:glutamate formiminotransferase / 5-formyltetrahydrofolate cyclo-ligase